MLNVDKKKWQLHIFQVVELKIHNQQTTNLLESSASKDKLK